MIIDDRQYRVTLAAFVSVGKLRLIFQDPMSSLNPRKKVRDLIGAGLDIHHKCGSKEKRDSLIGEYLKKVGLSPEQGERYPAQFSGGQRRRAGIARALIMKPKLIIADECIAALDASIQAQVVNLLKKLCKETDTSIDNLFKGDFGVSYSLAANVPISDLLRDHMPISLILGLVSMLTGTASCIHTS